MTITTLDRVTALIVIDLQQGIVQLLASPPVDAVVAKSALLARAFRRHKLPVVLVTATGGAPGRTDQPSRGGQRPEGWDQLVGELDAQPGDLRIEKQRWGAFATTDLETQLRALGVTQVVIAGVATSIGVESSARQASECGFHVTLAVDAMTDMSPEAHANSIGRIFPRLGESGDTQDIIAQLDAR
jgi:nicotinamidase-related amidase